MADRYAMKWLCLRTEADRKKREFVLSAEWSELKAFEIIMESIPSDVNLFLSNGTTVRYGQIFSKRLPHATFSNRGVSGIDGCTSTAVGCCKAYKGKTVLITGDMSMSYDIGALALPDIPGRMRIIVIDNNGGGIFRFIPTTSSLEEREKYFCSPVCLPLRQLADGYGWEYFEADSEAALKEVLSGFFDGDSRKILRIVCDGEKGGKILREYMNVKI